MLCKLTSQKTRRPTLHSSFEKSDGMMITSWKTSAEALMEVLLPDNDLRLEDKQQTDVRVDMAKIYKTRLNPNPIGLYA